MSLLTDAFMVDPIPWILVGVVLGAMSFGSAAVLWVETQKENWTKEGRDLEREDRLEFKKIKPRSRKERSGKETIKKSSSKKG